MLLLAKEGLTKRSVSFIYQHISHGSLHNVQVHELQRPPQHTNPFRIARMPFSHHSHSGQFCPGHAKDELEAIVQTAIRRKMQVFALTEHMPRHDADLYPEEIEADMDLDWQFENERKYYTEARRLRDKYGSQIELPIGFECDWIRPESHELIQRSIRTYEFDFFVGSVHHVHTVPIDFDQAMYDQAKNAAGGTDERLFEDYFDAQFDMLQALRPPVVGHFDLIRLKSDNPDGSFRTMNGVWDRILRNLRYVASYGGILELNFAAMRKGMSEPYPKREICQVIRLQAHGDFELIVKAYLSMDGKFCLSDDSHGIDQIATNYNHLPEFLRLTGISSLCYIIHAQPEDGPKDDRFPCMSICEASATAIGSHVFWAI